MLNNDYDDDADDNDNGGDDGGGKMHCGFTINVPENKNFLFPSIHSLTSYAVV